MAFPTFQAAGTPVERSTAGSISPAWPTHVAGDIGFLLIESPSPYANISVPAGFKAVPGSHIYSGAAGAASATHFKLYWKRATTNAEGAPTIDWAISHVRAMIVTFRGCGVAGRPWNAVSQARSGVSSTSLGSAGLTTTAADCLVVTFASTGGATISPFFSAWANADLANVTEVLDSPSNVGNGSTTGIATGEKAVAGAVAATTATLGFSTHSCSITLALTATSQVVDDVPYVHNLGTPAERATAGTISPAWPPHASGDLGFLIIESGGYPVANPAGWTELAASPVHAGVSGAANATSLHVFWKIAASGAEAAPTVTWVADHILARIITVQNQQASGVPINYSQNNAEEASIGSVDWPSTLTTSKNNTLILAIATLSFDSTGESLASFTSGGVTLLETLIDEGSTIGSGSVTIILRGRRLTAGTVTGPVGTLGGTSLQCRILVAVSPIATSNSITLDGGTMPITGGDFNFARHTKMNLDAAAAIPIVGGDMTFGPIFLNHMFNLDTGECPIEGSSLHLRKNVNGWVSEDPMDNDWIKDSPI